MPGEPKIARSGQASEERERRATTAKAEGNREAFENLAADAKARTANHETILQRRARTVEGLRATAANTVVRNVPIDLMIMDTRISFTQPGD